MLVHEVGCDRPCMFCDGGLSACTVCGAFEGAWPDDCPIALMTPEQSDEVYAGRLNYRDGAWRSECCQVMRPVHDVDSYMAEGGYVRDETDPNRWNRVGAS